MTNPIDLDNLARGLARVRALREACHVGHAAAKDLAVDLALDGWKASSVAFLAAAPAMADLLERYAARLAEVEAERDRLAAELAEARKVLAAERGVDGAPSSRWRYNHHAGVWQSNADGSDYMQAETVSRGISGEWYHRMRPNAGSSTVWPTAREAMQAADAALRGKGDTDE